MQGLGNPKPSSPGPTVQDQSHRHGWIVHDVEVGVVSQFRPDLQQAYGLSQGLGCGFSGIYKVLGSIRFQIPAKCGHY